MKWVLKVIKFMQLVLVGIGTGVVIYNILLLMDIKLSPSFVYFIAVGLVNLVIGYYIGKWFISKIKGLV